MSSETHSIDDVNSLSTNTGPFGVYGIEADNGQTVFKLSGRVTVTDTGQQILINGDSDRQIRIKLGPLRILKCFMSRGKHYNVVYTD